MEVTLINSVSSVLCCTDPEKLKNCPEPQDNTIHTRGDAVQVYEEQEEVVRFRVQVTACERASLQTQLLYAFAKNCLGKCALLNQA